MTSMYDSIITDAPNSAIDFEIDLKKFKLPLKSQQKSSQSHTGELSAGRSTAATSTKSNTSRIID